MRLFRAELSRLVSRRFTKIMVSVVLLVLIAIGIGLAATSHKHNAATRADALAQIQRINQAQRAQQSACEAQQSDPSAPAGPDGSKFPPGFDCSQLGNYSPTAADIESFQPHQFTFRTDTDQTLSVVSFLLALLAFAVGASFVGAEWSNGGMMNLLLWRPRRLPLLFGKLATLLFGVLVTSVVSIVAWLVGMWAVAETRGDATRITNGLLTSLALSGARGLTLILAAAVIGFGIASLGRHTATALGIAVGYIVVLELGARIVLRLTDVARPERFFLSNYAFAWLQKSQRFFDDRDCRHQIGAFGSCEPKQWLLHMNQSVIVGGVLVAVVVVWAFASFRRRDIT